MKKKRFWTLAIVLMVSMLVTVLPPVYGPEPSLLTEEELAFAEAVGVGDYAYGVDEKLAYDFGCMKDEEGRELWRPTGSKAEYEAAKWIAREMEKIGLQNVEMESIPVHGWTFKGAYVQLIEPYVGPQWLAGGHGGLPGTTESPYADKKDGSITAEIVYVGLGRKQDYEGKDVTGKLVAVDVHMDEMYWLNFPHMQAELKGAIGLVVHWINPPGYQDLPGSITCHDSECRPTIPALCISHRDFATLKESIEAGPTTVKIWCDAEVTIPDTGYNVVGYLPGTTHPDELIILESIYDKWWYGAHHHTSDVAAMMQIAEALIDSGYKPDRTLVFVTVPEEYGWTDTLFAWAIGSHWLAHYNHTDWGGRTRAFIGIGGSLDGDYTVRVSGTPDTYEWRQSVLPVFDEYFTTQEPWSSYYQPASTRFGGLPSTWTDSWNLGTIGIPSMGCSGRGSTLYDNVYHVNNDTMEWVSAEALAMTAIANGLLTIRLDRALLVPYNFANLADLIDSGLDKGAINAAGLQSGPVTVEIAKFKTAGKRVWDLIKSTGESENADVANALLTQTMKTVFSNLLMVGGWGDEAMLWHEHYQVDSMQLREAIEALEKGKVIDAIWALADVYAGYYCFNVDYEVYYHFMIEGTSPDYPGLNWAEGRVAVYTDVYYEIDSLLEKMATGNTDYSDEIASLQPKYQAAVENLEDSLETLTNTLSTATSLLEAVQTLLK